MKLLLKTILLLSLCLALVACGDKKADEMTTDDKEEVNVAAETEKAETEAEEKVENKEDTSSDKMDDKPETEDKKTERALGNGEFNLTPFTEAASDFIDIISDDLDTNMADDENYMTATMLTLVPNEHYMAVINIELEYLMQFDFGEWTDKEVPYPNGLGKTISSMKHDGDLFYYTISYQDDSGRTNDVNIVYDGKLDQFQYNSVENVDGTVTRTVSLQYVNDGQGGYYFQSLNENVEQDVSSACFQYLNGNDYVLYVVPTNSETKVESLMVDVMGQVPSGVEDLVAGYGSMQYIKKIDGTFEFATK